MPLPPSKLAVLAIAAIVVATPIKGELVHRWSFDESGGEGTALVDSVGGANGTIVDVGGNNASVGGGTLSMAGGAKGSADYADFPDGIVTAAGASGDPGDLTIEVWGTPRSAQNWSRVFSFGTATNNVIHMSWTRATNQSQNELRWNNTGTGAANITLQDFGPNVLNQESHWVVVVDDDGGSGGQTRISAYLNGVLKTSGDTDNDVSDLNDNDVWLGRSQWNDAGAHADFEEFRIYDHALDASEINDSFTAGPDAVAGGPEITNFTALPANIYEGDTVAISWSSPDAASIELDGAPVSTPSGSVQRTPMADTTYTLRATNTDGTSIATASVSVDPGVPVADSSSESTMRDVSKAITVTASDPNNYPSPLSYILVGGPSQGSLTGTLPNVTYEPAAGYSGPDSFTFKVNDGNHDSNTATVSITVVAPPSPPADIVLSNNSIPSTTGPGQLVGLIYSVDPNPADSHSYALVAGAGADDNALFSISGNQLLAAHDFAAEGGNTFSVRLRSTDNTARSFEKAIALTAIQVSDSILINEIHYDPPDGSTPGEFIELFNPGAAAVDLSGWTLEDGVQFTFPANTMIGSGQFIVIAQDPATTLALHGANALGPWSGKLDGDGEEVTLRDAAGGLVDEVDYDVGFPWPVASSGDGSSMELIHPSLDNDLGSSWRASTGGVTAGAQNSVYDLTAPPNIRQVDHSPQVPGDTDQVTITAKVTDPQGVASVQLFYQVVAPGQFIPSRTPRTVSQIMADPEGLPPANPAFENPANWTTVDMVDDGTGGDSLAGDSIYTVTLPTQPHRTLMRYRILVADFGGASAQVPYPDDGSLNFAYFVYNGVPDYVASTRSVHPDGPGRVWPKEMLTSVPVYHWIIRPQDMLTLQAYESSEKFTNGGSNTELAARRAYDWEGAMVYDGVVYDHVRARLRGGNSRYGDFDGRFPRGKRHYKFRFNKGHYFQARDESGRKYERKWRIFNVGRMFGTKGGNSWGLPEEIGDILYKTMGVPAQRAHWFHFRVVDDAAEAPDQYHGDFWGIMQAQERYDVRFLESRDMTKGNLYKMSDFMFDAERQRRYQALGMVSDGSEFDNIRDNLHGGQDAAWLNAHVNYERWYGYSAVGEAIRHYDIFPEPSGRHRMKNLVWYFEPVGADPTRGMCWHLPYDWDASWGPSFNNGWDHANNGLYGHVIVGGQPYMDKPAMKIAHRNVLRSFRDLVWQPDQIEGLLDDRAAVIAELSEADRDRWRDAPITAGTANDDTLAFKVQDMKNFAFTGWSGGSGPSVPGGRDAFLDSIADGPDAGLLPATPSIIYGGAANFPTDSLSFTSSAFSDPQGAATFAAMEWRIGEIEDPSAPAWNADDDFLLENDLIWGSGELGAFQATQAIPAGALKVGHTYRARVRHKDDTGRWSHWSAPIEFTTGDPIILDQLKANLMITEIMYHPGDRTPAEISAGYSESDFEYLEVYNISDSITLDLSDVRFTKGVDFDFAAGSITSLAPGAFALVVRNAAAFEMRYGAGLPVAGTWETDQNLSNGGERLKLSHGSGTAIHDFDYSDDPPWPTGPDGSGVSLTLIDPASAPDHAMYQSWRGSYHPAGTPGSGAFPSPMAYWMDSNGVTDPTGDTLVPGMQNVLVYALGADLLASPRDVGPRVIIVESDAVEYLALEYRRRKSATDITFSVEVAAELLTWLADPGDGSVTVPVSVIDQGDGTELVTVRSATRLGGADREFIRLRVSS